LPHVFCVDVKNHFYVSVYRRSVRVLHMLQGVVMFCVTLHISCGCAFVRWCTGLCMSLVSVSYACVRAVQQVCVLCVCSCVHVNVHVCKNTDLHMYMHGCIVGLIRHTSSCDTAHFCKRTCFMCMASLACMRTWKMTCSQWAGCTYEHAHTCTQALPHSLTLVNIVCATEILRKRSHTVTITEY